MKHIFKKYPKYKWALALLDLTILNVSFFLTLHIITWVLFKSLLPSHNIYVREWDIYIPFTFMALIYFQFSNLYKIQTIFKPNAHIFLLVKTLFFVVVGFILFQFVLKDFPISSRLFYVLFFVVLCINFIAFRIPFLNLIGSRFLVKDKVIILGAGKKGKKLLDIFKNKIRVKKVIGFLDDSKTEGMVDGVPILGNIEIAAQIAKKYRINFFILAIDRISRKRFFELFEYFQEHDLGFSVSSDYLNVLYENLDIDIYDEFGMARFPVIMDNKLLFVIKRIFDLSLCSAGLVFLFPLYITIAALIKLTSPGPVLYRQVRIGRNGELFSFYKFRSMYMDSDKDTKRQKAVEQFIKGDILESTSNSTKVVNTRNVTPVGKFLRKYSLDELPQLFNVLKGDMSLVGPRPCLVEEYEIYESWQKHRYANATPGCTGIWQVSGRSEVDFEGTILMDIYYNKNATPWFDLQILLKTIPVMAYGRGGK
ncbi:sugar transferase [Candidatus Amoebophilus asiaticus]|nr:sugar transferase [Candidatus Amoebophilus asiaticus]